MNGRPLASRLARGVILVGVYGWLIAAVIRRASGHRGNVTPTQLLAGALVVYVGFLLWAASVVTAVYVAYPRSAKSGRFTIGRGPRLARLHLRKGSVEWRLWSTSFGVLPPSLAAGQPLALTEQRRFLSTFLWPGFAAGVVLSGLAFALPGRGWILAVAFVCVLESLIGLTGIRAGSPVHELRAMKAYPAATEYGQQAQIAMAQRGYDRVLTLTAQALAQPHSDPFAWQMHLLAGSALQQLGRFAEAFERLEITLSNSNERMTAVTRSNMADAELAEALRARTPIPQADVERLRAWIDATPPAATEPAKAAFAHRLAMLRLLEGDPADAVSLCESALPWLDAQPEGRTRPDWQLVAATLVIAYARAGRESDARKLLAELLPTHPLTAAATAELSTAIGDSAPKA